MNASASLACVMAVHNEEAWLKLSLPYLARCPIKLLVLVLDRCKDASAKVFFDLYRKPAILCLKNWANWQYQMAEAKAYGVATAVGHGADYVLVTDADFLLDADYVGLAKALLDSDQTVDAVCFAYRQYSLTGKVSDRMKDELNNFLGKVFRRLGIKYRGGSYMVRAEYAHITDFQSDYESVLTGLRVSTLESGVHLRPRYDKASQYSRGASRAKICRYNLLRVAVASVLELSPSMLKGYLEGRCKKRISARRGDD
jgi:hypothetical protein